MIPPSRFQCLLLAHLLSLGAASAAEDARLQRHSALLTLDYQRIHVPGDQPLDLAGLHAFHEVLDGVYLGAGFYAPLVKGQYGGFVAADVGLHARRRLGGPVVALAGLSAGGGGGGRSVEHSKLLSGSGGFAKGYLGLGVDLGVATVGVTASRLKFRQSLIDGTQANLIVEIPFSVLTGPYAAHGQALPPEADAQAAREMGENQLSLSLDNYRQVRPQGSNHQTVRLGELQFAHYLAADSYAFAALGMGYRGLPLYNQLLVGVGQRYRWTPSVTLFGQLGLGSGGYAPDVIDTGPGLLLYPKAGAEFALSRDLGLALTAGRMTAPKGSSRNWTYGLSLTQHLRSGATPDASGTATYQGLRASLLHQTDTRLSYRGEARPSVGMLGLQLDLPLGVRWYLPLQASGAYNAYLGYPGYAEIFTGLGLQSLTPPGERLQAWGQALVGANVHGLATKLSAGLRYLLDDSLALSLGLGRVQARSASGGQFRADNFSIGVDYRFAVPTR